jgi:hypothetical protein
LSDWLEAVPLSNGGITRNFPRASYHQPYGNLHNLPLSKHTSTLLDLSDFKNVDNRLGSHSSLQSLTHFEICLKYSNRTPCPRMLGRLECGISNRSNSPTPWCQIPTWRVAFAPLWMLTPGRNCANYSNQERALDDILFN